MTRQQRELLRFLERYTAEHGGVSPTFDEMREALGLASKSSIHRLLSALEEQKLIRRVPNRQRRIEIVTRSLDLSLASDAEIAAEYHRRFAPVVPLAFDAGVLTTAGPLHIDQVHA